MNHKQKMGTEHSLFKINVYFLLISSCNTLPDYNNKIIWFIAL